jgi:hypothetical protein
MEWLAQNWIWLALGIGIIFWMSRGGVGGLAAHDHGNAGTPGTGEGGLRQAAPASDAGQSETAAAADTASAGAGATPAQSAPKAHRRHGCC